MYVNNKLLTYDVPKNGGTDCNCAYDKHVYEMNQQQVPFSYECEPNGNYCTKQIFDQNTYCVDKDGFIYSNDLKDCRLS